MKHTLRAVAHLSLACVVTGTVGGQTALESLTRSAPRLGLGPPWAGAQQGVEQVTRDVTTTQLFACAAAAWCIFVAALVLPARSTRAVPREPKPRQESMKTPPSTDAASAAPTPMPERF